MIPVPKTKTYRGLYDHNESPRHPNVGQWIMFLSHFEKSPVRGFGLVRCGAEAVVVEIIDTDHIRAKRFEYSKERLTLTWSEWQQCWRSRLGHKVVNA